MKITITQGRDDKPIVSIEGNPTDAPKKVAEAYRDTQKILEESKR